MAFNIGDTTVFTANISESDVFQFAEITGDHNPVHLSEPFAARSIYGHRIAHGMLVASFISSAIATRMPGPGSIYKSQQVDFLKPVYLGDTITVRLTITNISPRSNYTINTLVYNQNNELVVTGIAVVKLPVAATVPVRKKLAQTVSV